MKKKIRSSKVDKKIEIGVIEELELLVEIEEMDETLFAKQVSADVNQQWEDFMTCTCKTCKKKYNLMKVKYVDGNPVCNHCGNC